MAKGGTLWMARSYNNVEKDPEIDKFRTIYQKERIKESDLAALGGLSVSTVKNMFGGKTRRPQHATFAKMAIAMGYKYDLVRDEVPNYAKEIPKAKAEFKQYRQSLVDSKKRKRVSKTVTRTRSSNGVAAYG